MTQQMPKYVAFIEMKDGAEHGPLRITFATRAQTSRTVKARHWGEDDARADAFMAWHAAKTAGITVPEFEPFLEQITDVAVVPLEPAAEDEQDPSDPSSPVTPGTP